MELGTSGSAATASSHLPSRGAAILSDAEHVEHLRHARWFGGKNRPITSTRIVDRACWADAAALVFVEVEYASGPSETYVLADDLDDPAVLGAVLKRFSGTTLTTEAGAMLHFRPTHLFDDLPLAQASPAEPLRGEQSNTSIRFDDLLILKLFRRLQFGQNPDVEVGWFLTEHTQFRGTPGVAGTIDYAADGQTASLALLQLWERNRGDAWSTTLARLQRVLDGADPRDSLEAISRLGRTTAELHLALASGRGEFAADRISRSDTDAWREAIVHEVETAIHALADRGISLGEVALLKRSDGIGVLEGALKTRHHGDYHLGQVLEREDGGYAIIDFEGEPAKPLAQRRQQHSPLRDVAGMLRSFDYARHAALRAGDASDPKRLAAANDWYNAARQAFLGSYLPIVRQASPDLAPPTADSALDALELEKAAYEVSYELNNRPDWLPIPLAALRST